MLSMKIEDLIKTIDYKVIDEDEDFKIFKIANKRHVLYLERKNNIFNLERDLFEYLDNNKLPYSLLLHDKSKDKYYYLELAKEVNWVKSCFKTCSKDQIYLGKQVLNYQVKTTQLMQKFRKI